MSFQRARVVGLVALCLAACGGSGSTNPPPPAPDFVWAEVGPSGGFVASVAFDPAAAGEVWASGDDASGLFRSRNAGQSWTSVASAPPDHSTYCLTFDPNDSARVYAPNYFGRGLLTTSDGGATWSVVGAGLPTAAQLNKVNAMVVDPASSAVVFICTGGGLFRSADFGASFSQVASAAFGAETDFTAAAGSSAGVFVGTQGGRVFRSVDSGASWTEVTTGPFVPVTDLALTDSALYVAFQEATIASTATFTSAGLAVVHTGGGGGTINSSLWTKLAVSSGASAATDIVYVGTVITGVDSLWGFHASFDGGASFTQRMNGLDESSIFSVAVDPFDSMSVIVGTLGGGIYRSADAGLTWSPSNAGVVAADSLGFAQDATDPQHLLVSSTEGLNGTPGVYESLDGGATWALAPAVPVDALSLDLNPSNGQIVLIGGFSGDGNSNPAIHRSTSGVAGPWSVALATEVRVDRFVRAGSQLYALASDFAAPATLADIGIYASDDDGANWALRFNGVVGGIAPHPTHSGEVIAAGEDVWATTDSFATAPTSLGLMAFAPARIFTSVAFVAPDHVLVGASTGELFQTTNYDPSGVGVTWAAVPTPAADVFVRDIHVRDDTWYLSCFTGDFLALPTSTPGVLRTTDAGATWSFLESGMGPSRLVWSLHAATDSADRFFAGMWGGGLLRLQD